MCGPHESKLAKSSAERPSRIEHFFCLTLIVTKCFCLCDHGIVVQCFTNAIQGQFRDDLMSLFFCRVSAEDRLVKLQSAMEEFCAKYGSWEPPQTWKRLKLSCHKPVHSSLWTDVNTYVTLKSICRDNSLVLHGVTLCFRFLTCSQPLYALRAFGFSFACRRENAPSNASLRLRSGHRMLSLKPGCIPWICTTLLRFNVGLWTWRGEVDIVKLPQIYHYISKY